MKRETEFPPPMSFLVCPSPPSSLHSSLSPSSSQSQSFTASVSGASVQPSPSTQHFSPAQQRRSEKRLRGRPRKNRPPSRIASPAPAIGYPLPQLTSSGSGGELPIDIVGVVPPAWTSIIPPPVPATAIATGRMVFRPSLALNHDDGDGGDNGDGKKPKKKVSMACFFYRKQKLKCTPPQPDGPPQCKLVSLLFLRFLSIISLCILTLVYCEQPVFTPQAHLRVPRGVVSREAGCSPHPALNLVVLNFREPDGD